MKEDYTEIVVVLDRSGSMAAARADHEGGLNAFVKDQQTLAGKVNFTLIQFDSQNPSEVMYDGKPIADVGHCSLNPRGGTPLLDAIGKAVAHVSPRLDGSDPKPDQVVCMVITDGQENASREFTKETVKRLIEDREKTFGWRFLFLGANVDSFADAGALGMNAAVTMNYVNNAQGVQGVYASASGSMLRSRGAVQRGEDRHEVLMAGNFTEAERKAAMGTAPVTPTVVDDPTLAHLNKQVTTEKRKPARLAGDWSKLGK